MKYYIFYIFLMFCSTVSHTSYSQIITTVAGGAIGHGGYYGDGGQATLAQLGLFGGLAVDKFGNIYIGDGGNERIRKVDAATGLISTVAGTGVAGYNGDGILATDARLNGPGGVVVDSNGNFYIGDGNNRIRKVDISTGIITTVAGNGSPGYSVDGTVATDAACDMGALAFDAYGNIIYCSSRYYRIRKIDRSGIISTIAGIGITGNAGDGGPATASEITPDGDGICIDKLGNIYFSDSFYSIRKINMTTGIITRVAGTGDRVGFPHSGDGGPATLSHIVPVSVAVDDTGNLYVCDDGNTRIEKIDTFGIIKTIAGIGVAGYSGDGGPADSAKLGYPENVVLDKCGNVYIADFNNARVRKITYDATCTYATEILRNVAFDEKPTLYPNPVYDELNIDNLPAPTTYTLQNIVGTTVQTGILKAEENVLNLQALHAGVYIIELIDNEGKRTIQKIIKE